MPNIYLIQGGTGKSTQLGKEVEEIIQNTQILEEAACQRAKGRIHFRSLESCVEEEEG